VESKWLHQKKSNRLIFFCNGWGMDERPFTSIGSKEWDVLMFYDYTNLKHNQDLHKLLNEYDEVVLIAWSMGVWAGQQLFKPFVTKLTAALAINGTLSPINDKFGIPEDVVQATLAAFDEKQRLKFYYRMCRDRVVYQRFLENQPLRNIENQKEELAALLKSTKGQTGEESIYDYILVSEYDFIMPTKSQLNYWPEKTVLQTDGSHFLFYAYKSWDEIIEGFVS
jgi:biotin synthesis protein BioG